MLVAMNRRRAPRGRAGSYRISLRDNGMGSYRNSEYWTWLNDAVNYFQNIITGPSLTLTLDVGFSNQGSEGYLASCGPGTGNWWEWIAMPFADFTVSGSSAFLTMAKMTVNTYFFKMKADAATDVQKRWRNQFFHVACHEVFHAVGFGSLWSGSFKIVDVSNPFWIPGFYVITTLEDIFFPFAAKNVVGGGDPSTARYTASRGLAAYQNEMVGQSGVSRIPIENVGCGVRTTMASAGGTALSHWQRDYRGRDGIADIRNRKNQRGYYELMTGWSDNNKSGEYDQEEWVSRFSIESLRDIGYGVNSSLADVPLHYWKSVY